MTDNIFDEETWTRSSTSLIPISSYAKYLHFVRPETPHHISTFLLGNSFPQSNQSIHVHEPPLEFPLIAADIIDKDLRIKVPIQDRTDISGVLIFTGKETLTFNTKGDIPP